jgi:hypothetical protein
MINPQISRIPIGTMSLSFSPQFPSADGPTIFAISQGVLQTGIHRGLEGWATAAHGRNESCSSVYVMYLNFNGHIELWPISPNRGTLIIEMLVVQERIN